MKKQDNEQLKANELLQQLQAVYLNGDSDPASEREEKPSASEVGEASAPLQAVKDPVEETKPTETEPKSELPPQKKAAAPAAILALTEETPETANTSDAPAEKVSPVAAEPVKKEPAKAAKPEVARGSSQGTTMPKTTSNPFLKSESPSVESVVSEKTVSDADAKAEVKEKPSAPARPKVRPNATKVPPRKRSGLQTGAIRPKTEPIPEPTVKKPTVVKPRAVNEKAQTMADIRPMPKQPTRFGGIPTSRAAVRPAVAPNAPIEPSRQTKEVESAPKAMKVDPIVSEKPFRPAAPTVSSESAPVKEVPAKEPNAASPISPAPQKTVGNVTEKKTEEAEKKAEPRPASRVIVDFDGSSRSTVEPIENVEAAETVNEPPKKRSALRRARKQRKAEEGLNATAIIAKRTGLDESDIALIFELGYENELGRLVGYETLKKLKYEHLRSSRADTSDYYSEAYGYRGKEYTSATPREQVLAAYVHDRQNLIVRIALMSLLAVVLFLFDFPKILGDGFSAYAAKLPYLFPIFGFLLLGVSVFLMRGRLLSGWRAFLRFAPSPYSAVAVAIPFMLLYGIASIIAARSGALVPMNFVTEVSLLTLSVCDALRIADEIRTFRVISEIGDKTVLEEAEPRKKKLRQGSRTVKILNDEAGERLYRVRPTHEIVGFFRRVNDLSAAAVPFTRLTVVLLICAAACGILASLVTANPVRGILAAAATLMFSVPVSAIFLFFDPLRRANRRLVSRRSVLVGEGSVNEYSGQKTVIFNDTETFRAKRQTQIALRDGDDFRRDIRLAEILFRKLGGTLSTIGQVSSGKEETDPPVTLVRLTETGVEAVIDRVRLLAGDASFLTHSGIDVPKESTDRAAIRSRGVSILYVAINGVLKLTYEIAYTMSHSFRDVIALLAQTETTLAVQSYDPNLNDAFLHVGFADGDEVVRVIKPAQFELPTPAEITDTGAVTLDGPLATAYPLRAASLIVQARRTGFRALLCSILPGAVLAFFAARNLPARMMPFLPLFALGYRALWLAVSWMISTFSLSRRAVFDDTRENLANEDEDRIV